ncbi:alpha/beta hydrolase [Streptomyces sp. NBC_01351]|uniref:alpha/beta hydrolase n=1 Tax=Streptomyces sp. NBC_01351 TaxID=2903833 RepID=UPI002E36B3B7|nr:alpha/beta hydrolase [Streptomyces sp. NBC_01351]
MPRARIAALGALGALVLAALGAAPAPGGLRWGACPEAGVPDGMRCASIDVPLDYEGKAAGSVRLALGRIPATDQRRRIGSLVLNFGGPGAPGIATLAGDPKAFAELGKRYDLVVFDPRGVGHSEPVSCGGSRPPEEEGGDAAAQLAALRAVVRRCELASGPVLPYIGTVNVARDMDRIRQALGEDKLDFLGFSYGTRIGAVYAALFPQRTGRMVLDGVDTLTEPLAEQALVSARGQQRALDNFLAWCARRHGCVYGTNTRSAKEEVAALVERLDKQPLIGHDGSYFTGQDAVDAIGAALYSQNTWPELADALALAERRRDPAGLLQLGGPEGQYRRSDSGAVPADNAEAALTAVNCADDPERLTVKGKSPGAVAKELDEIQDRLRGEFLKASKIFGPNQLLTVLSCYGRPAGTDFIRRIDRPGAPRMLLVGTRGDPATPYEWTEETAERLGSAVIVDFKGDGHTGYSASRCVQGYADRFLIDGRLPSGTRSCPAVGAPPAVAGGE